MPSSSSPCWRSGSAYATCWSITESEASPLELNAIAAVTFTVNAIAQDGETTWFEGVLLLAIYILFALAFFFV